MNRAGEKMKVLLTGATGMVGRNILEHEWMANLHVFTPTRRELDLLDYQQVESFIRLNQPDLVIHAAGKVGGIQANLAHPVDFLIDNLDIGRNIIMASVNNGVKDLLNLASSCMYPRNAGNPLKEEFILQGELEPTNEGYALAKIMSTRLCEYLVKEYDGLHYKTIIPCNLYGRYDKFDPKHSHMIPAVIRKIYEAKVNLINEVDIWGDGTARREFMYAGDLADFIVYAIKNLDRMPQNINVGLGWDYSINEYYKTMAEVIGFEGSFVHDLSKPVGMKQKLVDSSKMTKFGWKPSTTLRDGLKATLNFFITTYPNQ